VRCIPKRGLARERNLTYAAHVTRLTHKLSQIEDTGSPGVGLWSEATSEGPGLVFIWLAIVLGQSCVLHD